MVVRGNKLKRWIALAGIAGITGWFLRRSHAHYRHRFTDFTDALAAPYGLGLSIHNWGFSVLGGRKHEAFRRRVIELAELRGGERVLDAGCGTGLTMLRTAEQYPHCVVHGINLSSRMITAAQQEAAGRKLGADLRLGSITELPYANNAFDVVTTNMMFHHLDLEEKRQAVAEDARVLKPGGRYISAEFGPRARNPVERRMAKGEYTLYPAHLVEAGFAIEQEALEQFVWGLQVYYRVAVRPQLAA